MLRTSLLVAVGALALGACGQQAQQAEAPPPAELTQPMQAQISDADFVQSAAYSSAFEAQAAEIAAERGVRADVKALAQTLQTHHTAAAQQLTTLAATVGVSAPTPVLTGDAEARLEALRNASPEAFDDLFLDQQVEVHENTIESVETFLAGAGPGPLRQWAETNLPTLRTHLAQTQSLENAT